MYKQLHNLKMKLPYDWFGEAELHQVLGGSPNRRYSWVKRALAAQHLIRLRRGLYSFSPEHCRSSLNLYAIAHRIYSPSYISLESAMSFHNLIPEAVYTQTNVSFHRSRDFETPVGRFSYIQSSKFSLWGVERLEIENIPVLMASPEKAILDYVYLRKMKWEGVAPLLHSLRMEPEDLSILSMLRMEELNKQYNSFSLSKFVDSLRGVLQ